MTTHTTADQVLSEFALCDDEVLLKRLAGLKESEKEIRQARERAEYEILRRLEDRKARKMGSKDWVAVLVTPSPDYDVGKLELLKEHTPPHEWVKAYTPFHTETVEVPAKLNMTVAKTWGRDYGTEVAAIIEAAKLPLKRGYVKVTRVEGKVA